MRVKASGKVMRLPVHDDEADQQEAEDGEGEAGDDGRRERLAGGGCERGGEMPGDEGEPRGGREFDQRILGWDGLGAVAATAAE